VGGCEWCRFVPPEAAVRLKDVVVDSFSTAAAATGSVDDVEAAQAEVVSGGMRHATCDEENREKGRRRKKMTVSFSSIAYVDSD
jgi:hypothetical protein